MARRSTSPPDATIWQLIAQKANATRVHAFLVEQFDRLKVVEVAVASKPRTLTQSGSVGSTDVLLFLNAADRSIVLTLPDASLNPGRPLTIIRVDESDNTVTVEAFAGDAVLGLTEVPLLMRGEALHLISDGILEWWGH